MTDHGHMITAPCSDPLCDGKVIQETHGVYPLGRCNTCHQEHIIDIHRGRYGHTTAIPYWPDRVDGQACILH